MAKAKLKLKVSFADMGMIVGVHLPSLGGQWPGVKGKLKAMKDAPEVAAFVATVEEIYRLIST